MSPIKKMSNLRYCTSI